MRWHPLCIQRGPTHSKCSTLAGKELATVLTDGARSNSNPHLLCHCQVLHRFCTRKKRAAVGPSSGPGGTWAADGEARRGLALGQEGKGEHLAAKPLEAKWQLSHTNGIWMEVEGIREEPALPPGSWLLAPRRSCHLSSPASPRCGRQQLSRSPSCPRNTLPFLPPSALGSCALKRQTAPGSGGVNHWCFNAARGKKCICHLGILSMVARENAHA